MCKCQKPCLRVKTLSFSNFVLLNTLCGKDGCWVSQVHATLLTVAVLSYLIENESLRPTSLDTLVWPR